MFKCKRILCKYLLFLVGAGKTTAELILKSFESDSGFSYKVIGIIDDHPVSKAMEERFKLSVVFQKLKR